MNVANFENDSLRAIMTFEHCKKHVVCWLKGVEFKLKVYKKWKMIFGTVMLWRVYTIKSSDLSS